MEGRDSELWMAIYLIYSYHSNREKLSSLLVKNRRAGEVSIIRIINI